MVRRKISSDRSPNLKGYPNEFQDANITMLQNLTQDKATQENAWALIQLGLSYYDQCNYNKSIDSFRLVIRLDPENRYLFIYVYFRIV